MFCPDTKVNQGFTPWPALLDGGQYPCIFDNLKKILCEQRIAYQVCGGLVVRMPMNIAKTFEDQHTCSYNRL